MGGSAGGHGEVLRGNRGEAAGTKSDSSFVERIAVNTGTVSVLALAPRSPAWRSGLGPPSIERIEAGGSRRSSRSPGEPGTGRRAAAVTRSEETAMAKDAPGNTGALDEAAPSGAFARGSRMQTKLHRWAVADSGRCFDDLFNLVHDPATLKVAWVRVAGNTGARSAGVDGRRAVDVEDTGVQEFLDDLRGTIRSGEFGPMPVRERMIPKPGGGKMRRLGIPTVADRVVQAALKLVLEPIFEADFEPVSYGFRPRRRAHDAIAEIHLFGTRGYRWVLDADIEAC